MHGTKIHQLNESNLSPPGQIPDPDFPECIETYGRILTKVYRCAIFPCIWISNTADPGNIPEKIFHILTRFLIVYVNNGSYVRFKFMGKPVTEAFTETYSFR